MSVTLSSSKLTQELTKKIDVVSSRKDREGHFRALEVESGAFVGFEDTAASSSTSCAMDCLKTPACVTFRMKNGVCSLGGYDWLTVDLDLDS